MRISPLQDLRPFRVAVRPEVVLSISRRASLEYVQAEAYQLPDGDEKTRHRRDCSFMNMCELHVSESGVIPSDFTRTTSSTARRLVNSSSRSPFPERMSQVGTSTEYSKFGLNHTLLCEDMLLSLTTNTQYHQQESIAEETRRRREPGVLWRKEGMQEQLFVVCPPCLCSYSADAALRPIHALEVLRV